MTVRMQHRRGTAAQWTSANPVLGSGEIGVETDTLRAKIGDGSTAWTSLSYFTLENGSVTTPKLADGAVDAAALADGSVTPAKLARPIGNLLTDRQALPATATVGAFWSANATEPSPGVFVASGSGPVLFTAEFPVEAYVTYTGWADVATQGRDRVAVIQFVNAAGSILLAVQSSAVPSGTRGLATVTAEAPAGAVRASIYPAFSAATPPSGETITVITAGAWVGAGGRWRRPGVPIPDLGVRPNPTDASQVQVWNASAGTWITV